MIISQKTTATPKGDGRVEYPPKDGVKGRELPTFIKDMIAAGCPAAGGGVNHWLYVMALKLHPWREASEIYDLLASLSANCGRNVSEAEIRRAIDRSREVAWSPGGSAPIAKKSKRPNGEFEPALRLEVIQHEGIDVADLVERSPIRWDDDAPRTTEILRTLFPAGSLLCCGLSKTVFRTRPLEEWTMASDWQLIVPSPMSAIKGVTQDGRESEHCLDNTGARRFLVVEFDKGRPEDQATLHLHLAKYAPLVMVVSSGGKSLHGWFYCQDEPEELVRDFMDYAVRLGADAATWTRSQFVRMPDGLRNSRNRQRVFYFDTAPLEA